MPSSLIERLYRADIPSFAKFAFNELSPQHQLGTSWHVDVMADALQGCLERDTRRLIINAPPRSLKSHCASIAMVVFALGQDPTRKIMVVAGSRALANDLQRRAVALMGTPRCRALFPNLRPTVTTGEITLPHGGGILYATVGQSLIGRGADIIVIDDPITPFEAQDNSARAGVNAWFDAEVVPRLNDKDTGVIVLVMQRVHLEDLTSHVRLRRGWTEIVLPVIALRDEAWPLHRRRTVQRLRGELLTPEREGKDRLIALLSEIDAYNFSAQYLQQPFHISQMQRVVLAHAPRPPNWKPEMGLGGAAFVLVRASEDILFEVFGIGSRPPYASASFPYTEEEWGASLRHQQRRLLAETQADLVRLEGQGH